MGGPTIRRAGMACAVVAILAAAACGDSGPTSAPSVGPDERYRPRSLNAAVSAARPVRGLSCRRDARPRYGVHLELFANRRVVIIPAGVGIAPPRKEVGAYVVEGRCEYPAITVEPTGVIQVDRTASLTLGDFFAIWGQPLSRRRLAGFTAQAGTRVRAFVGGEEWRGDLGGIALRRHAQIVLEVGGFVAPHRRYGFPPGL
jgi:hypothetical protein